MGHFLAALLGKLCADEIKEWLPWISGRIIRLAVGRLPEDQRERYSEEWHSHLDEVPGEIARLWTACGFLIATRQAPRPSPVVKRLQYNGADST
jgi:phage terminase Nu1 subunit (DNA packaging protein)